MLGLGSSLVYDGGTLADELLDSYPGAAAAYSLRSLSSSYSGAAVSIRPEEGVIGMVLEGGETGYNGGMKRVPPQNYATTETGRFSCEVYYDAQALPDGSSHRWTVRYGYTTSSNQGFTANFNLYNRQWTKVQLSSVSVDSQQIELYPSNANYTPIAGDQIFLRNIRCEAPSFSVDYDTANWQAISGGSNGTIVNAFDVGFDSIGGLDQNAVTTFAKSAGDALVLNVTGAYGDADSLVGIDKTYSEVTNAGTGTLTFDVYADCPSISGSVAIHAGVGTIQTAVAGSPITQGKWTSVTRASATTSDHGRIAIYVGGDGTSTLNQQLASGDKIYIRNLRFVHDNGAGDDLDAFPNFVAGLGGFAEYNDTSAVSLSYATSPTIDLTVQTWYDQSGNSRNATQTTTAYQPKIYDWDNGLVTENGKPGFDFDGTDDYFDLNIFGFADASTFEVLSTSDIQWMGLNQQPGSFAYTYNDGSGQTNLIANFGSSPSLYVNSSLIATGNDGTTRDETHAATSDGNQKVISTVAASTSVWSDSKWSGFLNWYFGGTLQELVVYDSDQTSNRSDIEVNINDYYSTY